MFVTRFTAPRFTVAAILLATSWAGQASAQSAGTSGEQWRASGVTRPTNVQPAATSTTNPAWKLPNGQQTADAQSAVDGSNPLRTKEKQPVKTAAAPEPRTFSPPTNVKKIVPAQSAAVTNTKPQQQTQQRTQSAAIAKAPVAVASRPATQANVQQRTAPAIRTMTPQRPAYQRPQQANNVRRAAVDSPADSLWQTINVAFQGETTPSTTPAPAAKHAPENLPTPSNMSTGELPDPVMHHFDGPGAFIGPYQPYGEPGGCSNGSCECGNCEGGCADGCCDPCGCGCPCGDPGCGCEPGCDCQPGCGCEDCKKDLFCIGPGDDESCHTVRLRWPKWQEVVVFGGVQGFKSPYDQDRDSGNFGVNEGFNIGAKVPYADLGYQFGWRGVQSQLNGDEATDSNDQTIQNFATAGLFHRQCDGLNFGVVWDALTDERFRSRQFSQIRSEISLMGGGCHEIGFTGIFGFNDEQLDFNGDDVLFQASDQYLLFYRFHGCNGGEGRFFAGANGDSDGIIGSDMLLPVGDRFSVQAGFTYLIPDARDGAVGASQEAWNIGLGLVWHWDRQARKSFDNCYRPMFNVADNGTLIIDQVNNNN